VSRRCLQRYVLRTNPGRDLGPTRFPLRQLAKEIGTATRRGCHFIEPDSAGTTQKSGSVSTIPSPVARSKHSVVRRHQHYPWSHKDQATWHLRSTGPDLSLWLG